MSSAKPELKSHHIEMAKRFGDRLAKAGKRRKRFPTFSHYMKWLHEST